MTLQSNERPSPTGGRGRYTGLLCVCAVLFVAQTGLVPFDIGESRAGSKAGQFFGAPRDAFTLPDIVSNLFLYVPVGVLFHWWFRARTKGGIVAAALALASATLLSAGVEWIQAYSPLRVSSAIDLVCNVTGAGVGVLISQICGLFVPSLLEAFGHEFRRRPRALLLAAYVLGVVGVSALPYSFSFEANLFKKSLKESRWMPFESVRSASAGAAEALRAENHRQYSIQEWQMLSCWPRWGVECLAFAVLAWLAVPLLRDEYGFSGAATAALIVWTCGGLALALGAMHLLLVTRVFDVTDVVFRFAGIASGLFAGLGRRARLDNLSPAAVAREWRKVAAFGCLAVLAYIAYGGVIPLTFDAGEGGVQSSLSSECFLPFFAYFTTRFDVMAADVMEKFVSYALFALFLVAAWPRMQRLSPMPRTFLVAAAGVTVSIPLEAVQMYISVRVASLTDLILAAGGCAFGVLVHQNAADWYSAQTRDGRVDRRARDDSRAGALPLSPSDELVATLIDPHAEAPRELPAIPAPVPKQR